jgi:FkbM family methyltransferase
MRKLYWSVKKRLIRLNPNPRVAERLGARWELDPMDWIDIRLLMGQPFETAQLERFTALVRDHRATHFLDCGANIGLYSVLMGLRFPDIDVLSFEPVAATRARLTRNVALNGLTDRVTIHPHALSDHEGEAEIAVDPKSTGVATLSAEDAGLDRRDYAGVETVRLAPLDQLAPLVGARPALKIDVEGHELEALAGMRKFLQANDCVCQIETRPRHRDHVAAAMAEAGLEIIGEIDDDLYLQRRG